MWEDTVRSVNITHLSSPTLPAGLPPSVTSRIQTSEGLVRMIRIRKRKRKTRIRKREIEKGYTNEVVARFQAERW